MYAFVQKVEHISFVEAVERLADRIGYTITYTGAVSSVQRDRGSRSRLIAANAAAQEFYADALQSKEAAPARQYLIDRNFDVEVARRFGCGFAPSGWDSLRSICSARGLSSRSWKPRFVRGKAGAATEPFHRGAAGPSGPAAAR